MVNEVTVVDYGIGNLFSVCRALEHCGGKVTLTSDPEIILNSGRVLLPGVGAFAHGMEELAHQGLVEAVRGAARRGNALLGICLGMQLLLDESEEFGLTPGLGLIPGRVVPIPSTTATGQPQKVPHVGWNELLPADGAAWKGTVLADMPVGAAVYFVHSFMAVPQNPAHRLADCIYGGTRVAAVIARDNVVGCQFHPEKSGEFGLALLRTFLA